MLSAVEDIFALVERGELLRLESLPSSALNMASSDGLTPLVVAASAGNTEAVRVLLQKGATIVGKARPRSGNTAVHFAARGGHVDCVRLLVTQAAAGGDSVNVSNVSGDTPLMFAALAGHASTVECLLDLNGDTEARNAGGRTALELAAANDRPECVERLLDRSTGPNIEAALTKAARPGSQCELLLKTRWHELNVQAQDMQRQLLEQLCVVDDDDAAGGGGGIRTGKKSKKGSKKSKKGKKKRMKDEEETARGEEEPATVAEEIKEGDSSPIDTCLRPRVSFDDGDDGDDGGPGWTVVGGGGARSLPEPSPPSLPSPPPTQRQPEMRQQQQQQRSVPAASSWAQCAAMNLATVVVADRRRTEEEGRVPPAARRPLQGEECGMSPQSLLEQICPEASAVAMTCQHVFFDTDALVALSPSQLDCLSSFLESQRRRVEEARLEQVRAQERARVVEFYEGISRQKRDLVARVAQDDYGEDDPARKDHF